MRLPFVSASMPENSWDVVVIGAGAAGLMTCLELPSNLKILLLNRNTSRRSSSRWAQGGIAAVTRVDDSLASHAEDTLKAGAGICDGDAVRMFVENAPKCVRRLENLGMEFDRDSDRLATTLEAAHSHRRVLHVQDRTGRALVEVLQDQVDQRKNLKHLRGVRVTNLLVENNKCCGVQVLDGNLLHWISARAVVLATGGGGHLFGNSTNPAQACGEGLALAWSAGAVIEDLEFVQFHPTALKLKGAPCFLISEALRGEGAFLVDQFGNSPVSHLTGADLAPRDQVSRALFQAMECQKDQHIGLDLRKISKELVEARFPSILRRCRDLGLDPLSQLIPVAPAAHYWMGGVATNLHAETTLPGLYAVGEVACTGLHGANRLASNSLMECLVFARQVASMNLETSLKKISNSPNIIPIDSSYKLINSQTADCLISSIEDLRKLCWNEAGVKRSFNGMNVALSTISKKIDCLSDQPLLRLIDDQNINSCYRLDDINRRDLNLLLDLNNRLLVSSLLFKSCLFRRESRGGHYRTDITNSLPYWKCHSRQKLGECLSTRPVSP